MLKVIHVHHDLKFVGSTSRFEGELFDNTVVIFNGGVKYRGKYENTAICLNNTPEDVSRAIDLCKNADVVVLYNLDWVKSFIANRLPLKLPIIWFFFGCELYKAGLCHSSLTLKAGKPKWHIALRNIPIKIARRLKTYIKWRTDFNREFNKAVKRVNYFFGLSKEEYDLLELNRGDLPQFIQRPFNSFEGCIMPGRSESAAGEKPVVIVGNSRSLDNNHLDVIDIIASSNNRQNYRFAFLFNYGPKNGYTKIVREKAGEHPEIKLVEDFMPVSEFKLFYSRSCALVINACRQMAVGNIMTALANGLKIYLNEKNIFLQWLRKEGFLVFTIEDFIRDLESGDLRLAGSDAEHNRERLKYLPSKYPVEEFQRSLCDKITAANADKERNPGFRKDIG